MGNGINLILCISDCQSLASRMRRWRIGERAGRMANSHSAAPQGRRIEQREIGGHTSPP